MSVLSQCLYKRTPEDGRHPGNDHIERSDWCKCSEKRLTVSTRPHKITTQLTFMSVLSQCLYKRTTEDSKHPGSVCRLGVNVLLTNSMRPIRS